MRKFVQACLFALGFYAPCYSQSTSILKEESLKNELLKTQYPFDSTAKAMVLYEEGSTVFEAGSYDYRYEVIIKILSEEAASNLAEIAIYKRENTIVSNISGETFNLVNGEVKRSKLESDQILKDKIDDNRKVTKFVLPHVKKGSVIHYAYKLHKTSSINIPDWTYQNIYPTLFSKYSVRVPINISINKILRTGKPFKTVTHQREMDNCDACEFTEQYDGTGTYAEWDMRNIPAFEQEPYSSNKANFMERIKVQITNYYQSNGQKVDLFNTWKDFSKKFLYDDQTYIGQVFKANGFLDEKVNELTGEKQTNLEKAQAINAYVRSNFKLIDDDDYDIKTVYKNQKGNVFGINMLLVSMLKKAGLDCDPVVLSTRNGERLSNLYPSPYALDYLVADFKDNGKEYFLDASDRNIPFGTLPALCYNGYARIVNKQGGETFFSTNDIKNKNIEIVNITPAPDNKNLIVKVDRKLGIFKSKDVRDAAKNSLAEATKDLMQSLSGSAVVIDPLSVKITGFENTDQQLSIHYEGMLKLDAIASLTYFNPFFSKFYPKNPFISTERKLPIEMDYKEDLTYVLNLKLPEGFDIDDYPKSISVKLHDDDQMLFSNIFTYNTESKVFSLSSKFQMNNTVYPADDYKNVRALFEKMTEEQNKKIVLKKL